MKRILILLLASFLLLGSLYAQDDHYTPVEDANQGYYSLIVWAEVQIDGVSQTSSSLEVGLFLGEDCYASKRIQPYFNNNFYRVKHTCSYMDEDLPITFKLYNHDNDEELDCDYTATTTGTDLNLGTNAQDCIVLNFVHETPITTFDITLTANPTNGGTVSGGGTFQAGTSITVTAEAAEGYTFVNWTEEGEEVSTAASYMFEVTATRSLTANFESSSSEPEYPWVVVDPNDGNYNAILTAIVQINGEMITDGTNWEVGAFYGDICRGLGNLENGWVEIPEESYNEVPYTYYMMMMLFGNNGEELTFKLANSATGEVHPGVCDVTITYHNDGEFGDHWDPIILNFVYDECFELDITGYNGDGGYYLIASPVDGLNPDDVVFVVNGEETTMTAGTYDLYYFDQNPSDGLEWINYKPNGNFNLESGKGYLYANSQTGTLKFCGTPYDSDGIVPIYKEEGENAEFSGWNLVGNPFPTNATIDRDCYVMNSNGSEITPSENLNVAAMQGVFVIAETDGETVTFTKGGSDNQGKLVLNINKERGNVIDRAIVRLGQSSQLPKFMLHENSPKLYIPQADADYAVVASNSENEMPVSFKATENGTYTLSVNQENVEMQYMHLIDHLTGADVNLLNTPNYQFNANVNDPESRFSISFKANTSVESQEILSPISYRSNGQLIIVGLEGESKLQVIDMLGRIISNNTISGEHSEMLNVTPGIYTIRLINNDNTYVQKIVVE